jgi:cobalt transporter subunit CbtB
MSGDRIGVMPARPAETSRGHDIAPVAAAVAALLIGGFLLYGVAFAPLAAVHAAAHDARHAFAFPCH